MSYSYSDDNTTQSDSDHSHMSGLSPENYSQSPQRSDEVIIKRESGDLGFIPTEHFKSNSLMGGNDCYGFQANFETQFAPKYQRTNKAAGKKNLRCFPHHRAGGHRDTGFCGAPVKIRVRAPASDIRRWKEAGTFCTVGELRADSDPAWISKGSEVGMDEIRSLTKSKESLEKPLFTSVITWDMVWSEATKGASHFYKLYVCRKWPRIFALYRYRSVHSIHNIFWAQKAKRGQGEKERSTKTGSYF